MNDVKLREAMLGTFKFFPMLPTQFIEIQTCVYKYAWHQFVNLYSCHGLLYGEDESSLNTYCKTQNIALVSQCPNRHVFFTRPYEKQSCRQKTEVFKNRIYLTDLEPHGIKINQRVEELAKRNAVSIVNVMIAWLILSVPFQFFGMTSIRRIGDNNGVLMLYGRRMILNIRRNHVS